VDRVDGVAKRGVGAPPLRPGGPAGQRVGVHVQAPARAEGHEIHERAAEHAQQADQRQQAGGGYAHGYILSDAVKTG
jgi:hypothetical protein